jgi:serine/threonine protein kinase
MPLSIGDKLGPYEILAPIGAGGMGEVHRARDAKLNRDVAIKVLSAALADDADYLARFQREAQVLAALNHPNIAAIYGFEDHAIVMELVEARRWPSASRRARCPSMKRCRLPNRSLKRSKRRTRRASSIAT